MSHPAAHMDNGHYVRSTFWSEIDAAAAINGAFRSPHEAYGVLAEEMMEFLDAIHANNTDAARREALQIAAVAYRFARDGWER